MNASDQLKALQARLLTPDRYVERRVDRICDLGFGHCRWESRQQIVVREGSIKLAEEPSASGDNSPVIVSLGVWRKARLPDLVATDQNDSQVTILGRRDRAATTAMVLAEIWIRHLAARHREVLTALIARVIDSPPRAAADFVSQYAAYSRQHGNTDSLQFQLDRLREFISAIHLLAIVVPGPDGRAIVTIHYTEWADFPTLRLTLKTLRRIMPDPRRRLRRPLFLWIWILAQLGHYPSRFEATLHGANHAHSFYLLVDPHEGVIVEDLYWRRIESRERPIASESYSNTESSSYALGCYHPTEDVRPGKVVAQLALAGQRMRLVWLLSVAILGALVIGLFSDVGADESPFLLSLALIPGGLLAFVSERSSELAMWMSRGIRRLALLVVSLVALLAFAVQVDAIKDGSEGLISDFVLGRLTLSIAVFAVMTFTWVCWCRVWLGTLLALRRQREMRQPTSPREFRMLDLVLASIWLVVSVVAALIAFVWPV